MKNIVVLLLSFLMLNSCKEDPQNAVEQTKKAANSIFLLDSKWQNQDAENLQLKDLKGKNLVVALIFTSCKTSCPLLIADMKKIESKLAPKTLKNTSMVLVSIDPETDTPAVLNRFAKEKNMYGNPWVFLRSNRESTRELANVLAVKYKQISPIIFSHSNIVSVFNKNGEMVSQEEGTVNSDSVAKTVNELN